MTRADRIRVAIAVALMVSLGLNLASTVALLRARAELSHQAAAIVRCVGAGDAALRQTAS